MTAKNLIFRNNTDSPGRPEPLRVCTNAEEARIAALGSITSTCGDCGKSWRGHTIPDHSCKNFKGEDLGPMKKARAEHARRELAKLRNAPTPPCIFCHAAMPAGVVHDCEGDLKPLPHDAAAAQWQRQGSVAALAQELQELQGGRP